MRISIQDLKLKLKNKYTLKRTVAWEAFSSLNAHAKVSVGRRGMGRIEL